MASKKDFSTINTGRVHSQIEKAAKAKTERITATPEEQAERAAALKTQGKKGCKASRINMAFTPDNHEFIKVMARISGMSMTEFTNLVIERYREEHPEIYAQAKQIIDGL